MRDSMQSQTAVLERLAAIPLPGSEASVADAVAQIQSGESGLQLRLATGYPLASQQSALNAEIVEALAGLAPVADIEWQLHVPLAPVGSEQQRLPGVRNVIAVASGKGGVGKSTVSANLALALAREGARVGVLDADIYGPSQAMMLGVPAARPQMLGEGLMAPIETPHGLQMMSMANLVTERTPMVWRGPMVSGALQQLLRQTRWDDLDYLVIDMPPGTGDIQLTLSQSVPVAGALVVTTPQDIALLDAVKGIEMFAKVAIPVLGIVENMSTHTCTQCGHTEAIFGTGGAQRLAGQYGVACLASLPLMLAIREHADGGVPTVVADPQSPVSQTLLALARRVGAGLSALADGAGDGPELAVSDD